MTHRDSGRSFAASLAPEMRGPLSNAGSLRTLEGGMSPRIRADYRSRILSGDYLQPIFFELDAAMHLWQMGYAIQWLDPPTAPNQRIPEFIARRGDYEIEVECKAKTIDAGRMISRRNFYRLADALREGLPSTGLTGTIEFLVRKRFPTSTEWRETAILETLQAVRAGTERLMLEDGTEVILDLRNVGNLEIPATELLAKARVGGNPYAHQALFGPRTQGGLAVNAVLVRAVSRNPDRFLDNVYQDLKDAAEQFSGSKCAVIHCFVPEIQSFDGLQHASALLNMTAQFFKKHGDDHIYAITYGSDVTQFDAATVVTMSRPGLAFKNPNYDEKYGPQIRLFDGED